MHLINIFAKFVLWVEPNLKKWKKTENSRFPWKEHYVSWPSNAFIFNTNSAFITWWFNKLDEYDDPASSFSSREKKRRKFVLVKYDGNFYPGKIWQWTCNCDDTKVWVKYWKWLSKEDAVDYFCEDILLFSWKTWIIFTIIYSTVDDILIVSCFHSRFHEFGDRILIFILFKIWLSISCCSYVGFWQEFLSWYSISFNVRQWTIFVHVQS